MPEPRARTILEARLYLDLAAETAGGDGPREPAVPVEHAGGWTLRRGATLVTVPRAYAAAAERAGARFGAGRSELIDAGQWKVVEAAYAHRALERDLAFPAGGGHGGDAYRAVVLGWTFAREAAVEMLKFIPYGEDEVPAGAVWTSAGAAARRDDPGRFHRSALERDIAFYESTLADFVRAHSS